MNIKSLFPFSLNRKIRDSLDYYEDGVCIFNKRGRLIYSNNPFQAFDLPHKLDSYHQAKKNNCLITIGHRSYKIDIHNIHNSFLVIARKVSNKLWCREHFLRHLAADKNEGIFTHTAKALAQSLPWRWVGVSRFIDDNGSVVKLLGWWDTDSIRPPFDLTTMGTPCEQVVRSKRVFFIGNGADLREQFPDWQLQFELNINSYAGLVYFVNSKPVGHIMMMHDREVDDSDVTADILNLAANCIGSTIENELLKDKVLIEQQTARTDKLTGLKNYTALQEQCIRLDLLYETKNIQDAAIIMCDLDNLKKTNDHFGHLKGDELIIFFAQLLRKTWGNNELLYRRGGDEFVIILRNITVKNREDINFRLNNIDKDITAQFPSSGCSFGLTFLSESQGSTTSAMKEADKLLYIHKNNKTKSTDV